MPDNRRAAPIRGHSPLKTGNKTNRLRLYIMVPLLFIILAAVAIIATLTYLRQQHDIEQGVVQLRTQASRLYEESIRRDVGAMHTVMDMLERDEFLRQALERRDRQALLKHAAPLFDDMMRNYKMKSFYFSGPDRVNLLRVHQPQQYGDVVDRVTTRSAERSGAIAYGLELGQLGLFTLQLVSPWYDTNTRQLLGYVGLGMEIGSVLESVHNLSGLDVHLFIKKEFLQRQDWEEGMRAMGRTPEWDRFPNVVLSAQTPHDLPSGLGKYIAQPGLIGTPAAVEMTCNGLPCQAMSLPLLDAAGRNVADMVLVVDTSQRVAEARQAVMSDSGVSAAGGVVLFVLCFWVVGRIGRRIERNEQVALQEQVDHDELTGLYNHRMFCSLLKDEIARAQRYRRPVSILMVDIDHFRRVNDTYGKAAGDRILKELAHILQQSLHPLDRVCRYGGEEISLILPETGEQAAMEAAERLREAVENFDFKDDSGQEIMVTVSIGVATLPEQTTSLQELVNGANTALHAAKEGGRNRVCSFEKPASNSGGE